MGGSLPRRKRKSWSGLPAVTQWLWALDWAGETASRSWCWTLLQEIQQPMVLDADGINALEGHIDVLDARRDRITVLTPHDGEFARIGGDLTGSRPAGGRPGLCERPMAVSWC